MSPTEQKGVSELKDVCVFVAKCVSAEQKMLADGKFDYSDIAQAFEPLLAGPAALKGITEVPGEVADLDPSEAEECRAAIAENFDLTNDQVEEVVENVLGAALQIVAAVMAARKK